MKDSLGDRMKSSYEDRTRYKLPRRTHIVIRIDGCHFHTYTKHCERPYDSQLMEDMDETAKYLCQSIMGTKLAFVQSDEISLILTDFDTISTETWFDGNIQKMASVSASMAAAKFNDLRKHVYPENKDPGLAYFDARVFTIPDPIEVHNYLVWRQQDATRNSIQMAAQSMFSHKQLQHLNCNQLQELMWSEKGVNWSTDYPIGFKRGRAIITVQEQFENSIRTKWKAIEPPVFTQEPEWALSFFKGDK